jgi:hypothetical protein
MKIPITIHKDSYEFEREEGNNKYYRTVKIHNEMEIEIEDSILEEIAKVVGKKILETPLEPNSQD